MGLPQKDDSKFRFSWHEEENGIYVDDLNVSKEHRNQGIGSTIIETMKRIAYYQDEEYLEVSIGGGEKTEQFLKEHGFYIIRRRLYDESYIEQVEGKYGVDAVYRP